MPEFAFLDIIHFLSAPPEMKISKSAKVTVSNASISFEALAAFLRVIQEVFLSVLPQDKQGDIKWDINVCTAQEVNSLSSDTLDSTLDDKAADWIREHVILRVRTEIASLVGECWWKVECRFLMGEILTIEIRGNSDFVDLMHLRLTEWSNNLPRGRFSFFKLLVFIVAMCVGIFTLFAFTATLMFILKQFGLTFSEVLDVKLFGDVITLSTLGAGVMAGVFTGTAVLNMWPCVDLNIGLPTKEQIYREKIIRGAQLFCGLIAVCGSAVGIYAFFFGG